MWSAQGAELDKQACHIGCHPHRIYTTKSRCSLKGKLQRNCSTASKSKAFQRYVHTLAQAPSDVNLSTKYKFRGITCKSSQDSSPRAAKKLTEDKCKNLHSIFVTSMVCLSDHGRAGADHQSQEYRCGAHKEQSSTSKHFILDATHIESTPRNQGARSRVSCRGIAALHPKA